jgi:hypothetical protein
MATDVSLKSIYNGEFWKIYYFDIPTSKHYQATDLEASLQEMVTFLDRLNQENEEVLSIIPDTGSVDTLTFGVTVTGVVGFAVVVRKKK